MVPPDPLDRRRLIHMIGAGTALAFAGCLGDDNAGPDDDADDVGNGDDSDDASDLTSLDPSPEGEPLSEADIARLLEIFDDTPMSEDHHEQEGAERSYTPRHVWKWVSDVSFIGLHFNDPNPEEATALDYVTVGRKGLFTEESQPDEEFTHFHQHTADSWEGGHGGEPGAEGYWLTHLAVDEIEYPFHAEPIRPQVDYGFNPTPPEAGTEGHDEDFEVPHTDEGSLSEDEIAELVEFFDDQPFTDDHLDSPSGEHTPRHVWKWVNEDVVLFLHWNEPEPAEATELDYFGIGVRGQFDEESIPGGQADDFTHFHKWEADSWEAGHGAQSSEQHGFWLVHHAVRSVEYPFHDGPIDIGIDREFMPTPIE